MKKLIYISLAAFAVSACSEDEILESTVRPTPGQDVQFSIKSDRSRTIYADEANGDTWRINWVNGDVVNIYSPQAASDFNQAPYKVVNTTTDGADDNTLNYAMSLEHVNPTGVRWGESSSANFYSVYPFDKSLTQFTTNATHENGAVIKAKINESQVNSAPVYVSGTNGNTLFVKGDMPNNIMYAAKIGAKSGETVELQYNPAATVLQFKLGCLEVATAGTGAGTKQPITIRSISVTSPSGSPIAGTLSMDFDANNIANGPTLSVEDGSNTVTLQTRYNNAYQTIPVGGSMTANLFIAVPSSNTYDMKSGWTITVDAVEGRFSMNLAAAAGKKTELIPGEIHQINLPNFSREKEWTDQTDSWLSTIPSNVYVSELSLPGAWYCYDAVRGSDNEGYQAAISTNVNTAMETLFKAGVRAFHLETRVGTAGFSISYDESNATVVISGTGDNRPLSSDYYNAIAINSTVTALAKLAADNPSEFCVLTLTYTEDTKSNSTSSTYRNVWLAKINSVLNSLNLTNLAMGVNKGTTIEDVKGKLIVLVCVDNIASSNMNQGTFPNALIGYTDYSWSASTQNTSLVSNVAWKAWPGTESATIDKSGDFLNYTVANRTLCTTKRSGRNYTFAGFPTTFNTYPTMDDRKNSISSIVSNSAKLYGSGDHNVWYLIGAGGTCADASGNVPTNGPLYIAGGSSYSSTAGTIGLNEYLANTIAEKVNKSEASTLGLVFVNQITGANATYHGSDLVTAIIDMNNKFYLQRDETATVDNSPLSYTGGSFAAAEGWDNPTGHLK